MTNRQPQALPLRVYEPNIIHNPTKWMGIWTPHGWRVHLKRFGKANRITVTLSGDGQSTFFPEALLDPKTHRVEWQDDLHLTDDPFTDGGIYPCDPRVEYPAGQPRWAVSHTLLCYPVADHNLFTHEYTWDMVSGHLQTHFREHVVCEEARTDAHDGKTVRVRHQPISTAIEGNVRYANQTSAVRGVWGNPQKSGKNFYTRRLVQKLPMLNAVYLVTPHAPVVQCHGLYEVLPEDDLTGLFDPESCECRDVSRLVESLLIPHDQPKIALLDMHPYQLARSRVYEGEISMLSRHFGTVDRPHLDRAKASRGAVYQRGRVGYAHQNAVDRSDSGYAGYTTDFDLNGDGVIGDDDLATIEKSIGRKVRLNLYKSAYFGGDWLSTSICLNTEHQPGVPIIADYEIGGGYDSGSGTIRLLDTPGANQPVWVEYHYDAPAAAGIDNILVHLYREIQ